MNQITLIGRIGQEPKSKTFDNGGTICQVSIATDESYKKQDGSKVDDTQWFNVSGSGKQAEFMAKYLNKGMRIAVTGRMRSRKYQKDDGSNAEAWEVKAERFEFVESKAHNQSAVTAASDMPVTPASDNAYSANASVDDDLPF